VCRARSAGLLQGFDFGCCAGGCGAGGYEGWEDKSMGQAGGWTVVGGHVFGVDDAVVDVSAAEGWG
jgi:hypothetical protein